MSLGFNNFLQLVQNKQEENLLKRKKRMQKEQRNHEDEIDKILKDPKKYRKMMLIMQQTLYDLGYHQSAKMLQSESGINYYSSQLLSIKELLLKNDFQSVIGVVQQLQQKALQQEGIKEQQKNGSNPKINSIRLTLPTLALTKMMIYETYCMHKIINKEFQSAMIIISQNIKNQTKKQFLCQALVLGNHHLSKQQLEKKKQGIFKFCLSSWQQIGEKEIQRVIESYREHEGEFNKQVKGLLGQQKLLPPMKIWSVQLEKDIKHTITHMKLSLTLNSIYLIEEDKDVLILHLISIDDKKLQYMRHCVDAGYGDMNKRQSMLSKRISKTLQIKYKGKRQSVQAVALNPYPQNSNVSLALCSFNVITILSVDLQILSRIESNNKIEKYLHIDFHPVSELLYTCGYFQTLNAIDSSGQLVQTVYPFPKTRKFLFSDNSHTLAISLVTNRVYKHSLDEQTLVKQIQLDEGVLPMDICVSDKDSFKALNKVNGAKGNVNNNQYIPQYVGISSLQFIYILDSQSLNILGKTTSPTNPNKLIVEVKFYHNYLISLAKNFTSYTIETDVVNKQNKMRDQNQINGNMNGNSMQNVTINKYREWMGEGTFIIEDNLMMSGYKEVIIWSSGETESQMIDESLQQGLQEYMIEQIQDLSDDEEELGSESSLNSNEMEEDENSDDQDNDEDEEQQFI